MSWIGKNNCKVYCFSETTTTHSVHISVDAARKVEKKLESLQHTKSISGCVRAIFPPQHIFEESVGRFVWSCKNRQFAFNNYWCKSTGKPPDRNCVIESQKSKGGRTVLWVWNNRLKLTDENFFKWLGTRTSSAVVLIVHQHLMHFWKAKKEVFTTNAWQFTRRFSHNSFVMPQGGLAFKYVCACFCAVVSR